MSFPRYPKYKASGVEWLGQVPEHWKVCKMKWVARMESGHTPDKKVPANWHNGNIPWVSLNDTGFLKDNDYISDTAYSITEQGIANSSARLLPARVVVFSRDATIGRCAITTRPMAVSQHFIAWVCGDAIIPEFLLLRLRSMTRELDRLTTGATLKTIGMPDVRTLVTPIPPIDEQEAIIDWVSNETGKIDGLVAEQRRLMELLKEKRQAVISHAVTKGLNPHTPLKPSGIEWLGDVPEHWKVGKCGFYLTILSGFAFPSAGFTEDESDTKLLRGINVGVSRLKWDETVYWRRSQGDGLDVYEMRVGDLVMGMDRPLISEGMRVAKVKESDLPCLLLQRVTSLKTGNLLNADYLLGLLSSEAFVAHFSPDTTGVSVPHISPEQISNFVIPVPPVAEQETIVAFVAVETAKLATLTAEAQRAIDLLQERRTALISAAVTGQIDVRNVKS